MGSFRTGGLFSLSSSALLPHLEQSAFCFLLQDPFQQEDCFTCLVQHLNTIWSRERCDSFLRVPSHRRIFLLLYFCSSTPFETKCILILIPGSLPTGRLFHLSSSKSVLILFWGSLPTWGYFYFSLSSVPHHLKQRAFWFFSQGRFPQEDSFTCLVQSFKPILKKRCVLILFSGSLPTRGLLHLSISVV